jgi:simple sugar transport system permease protein
MSDRIARAGNRLRDGIRAFGLARGTIVLFLVLIWLVAGFFTDNDLGTLLGDCLVRTGMNGILVLALVLPVRAGNGLNFGLPLGIVCGLAGGILSLEFAGETPFGIEALTGTGWLSRGLTGFLLAHLIALPAAALLGYLYGWLLERVRGQEMMVGMYVGFGAVAGMCVLWLVAPLTSSELVWSIGGKGVRNQILLDEHYKWVLDGAGEIRFGAPDPVEPGAEARTTSFRRQQGFYLPTGLLVFWLAACGVTALFLRTRIGIGLTASGENPRYAESIGIRASRMRVLSIVISTMLAASGILVYSQSYGFFQLYKAPLWMAFPTVAALLLGGASIRRASVVHVIIGTFLFQSLLTTSLPTVNSLVQNSPYREGLSNLPEIARLIIQNGVILYALTRLKGGGK